MPGSARNEVKVLVYRRRSLGVAGLKASTGERSALGCLNLDVTDGLGESF